MMRYILFWCFIILSCNNRDGVNDGESKSEHPKEDVMKEASSIIALDPRLRNADSLVFVFYKDPHGPDSLRYTRYYKQTSSTDTLLISFLKTFLQKKTERVEKVKPCRSEGKIWCFKEGNIFQTIYFSSHNRDCSFLYIIKNGQFYYSDPDVSLFNQLELLKDEAMEPPNNGLIE